MTPTLSCPHRSVKLILVGSTPEDDCNERMGERGEGEREGGRDRGRGGMKTGQWTEIFWLKIHVQFN